MNAIYRANLTFTPSANAVKHRLRWGLKPGIYDTNFRDLSPGETVVKIELPQLTEVFFTVTAIGATALESLPSNEVRLFTPPQPVAPPTLPPDEPPMPETIEAPEPPTGFDIGLTWVAPAL